jgi:hypothetical protein
MPKYYLNRPLRMVLASLETLNHELTGIKSDNVTPDDWDILDACYLELDITIKMLQENKVMFWDKMTPEQKATIKQILEKCAKPVLEDLVHFYSSLKPIEGRKQVVLEDTIALKNDDFEGLKGVIERYKQGLKDAEKARYRLQKSLDKGYDMITELLYPYKKMFEPKPEKVNE